MSEALIDHYRAMARNNAWSNERLLRACLALSDAEFRAPRVSFFPSLVATLNHNLIVDLYYVEGLESGRTSRRHFDDEIPHGTVATLIEAQRAVDRRLIAFCDGLGGPDLARAVGLDRGARGESAETVATVLPHLFVHQIHHRGQAHAMLAGTAVKPPQLDEFFLDEDAPTLSRDLATFGI